MGARTFVRANWRVLLLTVFVTAALVALFIPGGVLPDDSLGADEEAIDSPLVDDDVETVERSQGWTNIVYGLSLDGGTRISAPVVGMTVDEVEIDIEADQADAFSAELADELGIDATNASVRYDQGSGLSDVEVFTRQVTAAEFATALQELGVDVDESEVRNGVTQATRDEIIDTIDTMINAAGLSGGRVSQQEVGGEFYIVTEVPDRTPEQLRAILSERGIVEVWAHHPDGEGGQANETVLTREDFAQVDPADYNDENGHHVPVAIRTGEPAERYQERMNELGFTREGVGQCRYGEPEFEGQNYCLLTVLDGQVVDAHSMGDLAEGMRTGQWANNPTFIMGAPSQQDAQALSINLNAGALAAPLDFENDQVLQIQPALAEQFKNYSLLIGIVSILAVSGMVYLRYRDHRVALPMIVTALSEVVILLGFAALIRYPIGLPEVAAFVAVVGTGVDDLIIIADEVMSEGDVNSRRVFESRFRKAFWVIGAAAGTTIVAMSPLALLNLGDLRGFAIITILGVLIGVLVTRPAYGDILRRLLTDR
ncbi:preprotein translocase subunit SecD [Natronobiforma cellulositropha]|uniref:preprotein translocase subunit SecD n=1 Tax=Natronobiforma cellulositropha TaxID=1679076 RepID=UPI0021D5811D|nr:preprotein translocase subunit SecD [Natronobiforma cellulositropha]